MLYCFLTDTAFLDPESDMTNIATIDIPCGFMHPEILEYLMEQLVIRDRRAGRLPINYRVTEFSSDYNPYLYHTMNYEIDILFLKTVQLLKLIRDGLIRDGHLRNRLKMILEIIEHQHLKLFLLLKMVNHLK